MKETEIKELCLELMKADSEKQVIALLKDVGYWNNPDVWRFYGDYENNYNTIGNQQSRPDSALVEKLVNSVDARLMNECLGRSIDPESSKAPKTIREAVALFFEKNSKPDSLIAGKIREWGDSKRNEVAKGITLVATGAQPKEGNPCFTITDCGEGQTPQRIPETLLSLNKSNKLRIPFVQGKFDMGGTGVLKFCGRCGLELIISRRNPAILNGKTSHTTDSMWGFTVVRREDPEGNRRSSAYTYLAPLDADKKRGKGGVLCFSAKHLPIFPDGKDPYVRNAEYGTLIKLYEYSATGHKSNMMLPDGMLGRMDILLPEVALPIRLHECRVGYKGHGGSFDTTLTGLGVRLEDDKGKNLEQDPSSCAMRVAGEEMIATVYAFKKGRAETYRKHEGIIFTLNGQTHGHLTPDFFRRKKVGLSYLADSILVIVDCSKFSGRAREDLFMNSRDRLSNGELRAEIENSLEDLLKTHEGLRALKEKRRREEIESKLDESKPLEDILESLLKQSPTLAMLFLKGKRLSTPFKTIKVQTEEKVFHGKRFPTYFRFKGKEYGDQLHRDCHINLRCRIAFETDVTDDYFSRDIDPGQFSLYRVNGKDRVVVENYILNLQSGRANLSITLPDNCQAGDLLKFVAVINDRTLPDPFDNYFEVSVKEAVKIKNGGGGGERLRPPSSDEGEDREAPVGIQLPNIKLVYEQDWNNYSPAFTKETALRIKNAGTAEVEPSDEESPDVYDFFINMDNLYLKSELKIGGQDIELVRAQFKYGMVLLGLALLQQDSMMKKSAKNQEEDEKEDDENKRTNIEDKVEEFTKAVSPVLIPMIESLGALEIGPEMTVDASGDAT